ncbi:hypothetical protein JCM8547_006167 [Rhodosporidiobolus lusitaniae]
MGHLSISPSAYTASLPPTYRRSSFPSAPPLSLPSSSSSRISALNATSSDSCAIHDQFSALCVKGFDLPSPSSQHPSSSSPSSSSSPTGSAPSSRKSSASSLFTTEDDDSTPLSSRAGSVKGHDTGKMQATAGGSGAPPAGAPAPGGSLLSAYDWGSPASSPATRSLSPGTGMDKAKREAVKGWEDPALAAARRALWADDEAEGATLEPAKEEDVPASPVVTVEAEADEDDEGGEEDEEEDDEDEWELPPARAVLSATLAAPVYSCIRSSPSSRTALSLSTSFSCDQSSSSSSSTGDHDDYDSASSSFVYSRGVSPSASSASSSSSSTPTSASACPSLSHSSVSFSTAPPETCSTYSSRAYSRRGDAPVEKLSIRDWMELTSVREAVGVWSGRIQKWDEFCATLDAECAERAAQASGQSSGIGGRKGRSPYSCSAMKGVVQIARSTPSSPTEPHRQLADL